MKPKPKELFIQEVTDLLLWIFTHSADAAEWVRREAPTFGEYLPPGGYSQCHTLVVSPAFVLAEVIAYLESYNKEEPAQ